MRKHASAYAVGSGALGLLGFISGDFALQWQPVPEGIPGRTLLAYANSLILLVAAMLVLTPGRSITGALLLALLNGLYVVLLHLPRVVAAPADVLPWLGLAEILSLAAAGLMLALILEGGARTTLMRATQLVFGTCPVVYGVSHFVYPEFTASMIPGWIPARLFWAYATGVAHVAAGVAIAGAAAVAMARSTGRAPARLVMLARLAAVLLTVMLGLFTVLVHLTGVAGDPGSRHQWTMLFVATTLTGAAWIVSAALYLRTDCSKTDAAESGAQHDAKRQLQVTN